jgi:hypothetical protein
MINMIFENACELEAAEKLTGVKFIEFPDYVFNILTMGYDLNQDDYFKKLLLEIDGCDVPLPNVVRDIKTNRTSSFDKVSTGVRVLWLIKNHPSEYLYPTQWLGENCYQELFNLGKEVDVYIYEDSRMFLQDGAELCTGEFVDVLTGSTVTVDNDNGYEYYMKMDYNVSK